MSTNALAQPAAVSDPAVAPVTAAAPAPTPPASGGWTLRNGFSLSVGQEFGSGPSDGLSGQLYGLDWRIGGQINPALAVYVHSHLSLGTAHIGQAMGYTGNFATAVVGEYTLPQRIFFGAGAGYGVLNNPDGPLAEARVGYYPFPSHAAGKSRRLDIALDARWYFAGPAIGTVSHIALSLGYDRF